MSVSSSLAGSASVTGWMALHTTGCGLICLIRSTRETPMTDDTILQKEIALLLFQNLNVEVSSVHDDLIENGLLDSLKIVELLMELENHFVLKIPFEGLEIDSFR